MKRKCLYLFLCLLGGCCFHHIHAAAVLDGKENIMPADSIQTPQQDSLAATSYKFKPNPIKAVWMGAIIPGYGQIYNRKYWKLPIVYGGFLGCAYAISWNGTMYSDYKKAYRDIIDNDPTTNSFMDILPEGYTIESLGGMSQYTKTLQTKQNTYRRYRDLSIVITVALYAITLVDAYVDAQLFDFDISPDLTMHVTPALLEYGTQNQNRAFALQLTIDL
ncbi:MAG: hypothetical protein IAA73_00210 [Bacteroidetes bacterium]|uniref:DUF5683 domain-containing protein n=1 Tax=Candidatus Gallipaludibacter merdavium TaxID=2840839 RepID=A0A9D9N3G0_9BACT|nr:hypothetical protein [Candidatus Gallipaludibacter merdavium]